MPKVEGKEFPYTQKGVKAAGKALKANARSKRAQIAGKGRDFGKAVSSAAKSKVKKAVAPKFEDFRRVQAKASKLRRGR